MDRQQYAWFSFYYYNRSQGAPASHILALLVHRLQFESHVQQGSISHLAEIRQMSLILLLVTSLQMSATLYFLPSPSLLNSTPLSGKVKKKTAVSRFIQVKELILKRLPIIYRKGNNLEAIIAGV